jgi:glycine oxidase
VSPSGSRHPEGSIAIIGGGIIGMSIAWRLSQSGCKVVVVEAGSVGAEASWAGAGMLSPGGEVDAPSELASLYIESRQMYSGFVQQLEEASGLSIDYQECGALELAYSLDEAQILEEKIIQQDALDIVSNALTVTDVTSSWPKVRAEGLIAARFYPGDAIVNPRDVLVALAAACRKTGVVVRQNCPASSVVVSNDQTRIESKQGTESYEAVVIAAGAWSSAIQVHGVPALPPATPVKGHLIGYQQPWQTCTTILRHGRSYLLQRANGLLIAGTSVEHVGFDRSLQPDIIASLAGQARFMLPHLRDATPSETWAGFRPASDALHVGPWHSTRLYLAYGHYRNGILLAPLTAQRIGAQITANLGMC